MQVRPNRDATVAFVRGTEKKLEKLLWTDTRRNSCLLRLGIKLVHLKKELGTVYSLAFLIVI
jgi:hypothetical protein